MIVEVRPSPCIWISRIDSETLSKIHSPRNDLTTEPPPWANSVENDIAGDFEDYDADVEQLLPDVVVGLSDANIFQEAIGESVATVIR